MGPDQQGMSEPNGPSLVSDQTGYTYPPMAGAPPGYDTLMNTGVHPGTDAHAHAYAAKHPDGNFSTVVVTQPTVGRKVADFEMSDNKPPRNWMALATTTCAFCFWPTAIFAIYFSYKANKNFERGNMEEGRRHNRMARNLIYVSIFLGLVIVVVLTAWRISIMNTMNAFRH